MADTKFEVRYLGALDALQHKMTNKQYGFLKGNWVVVQESDYENYKAWEDAGVSDWETRTDKPAEKLVPKKKAVAKKKAAKKPAAKKKSKK